MHLSEKFSCIILAIYSGDDIIVEEIFAENAEKSARRVYVFQKPVFK